MFYYKRNVAFSDRVPPAFSRWTPKKLALQISGLAIRTGHHEPRQIGIPPSNGHDAWDALPSISAPTLVLHGTDDLLSPVDNALLLAERIPNARVRLLPGARHAYFEEDRTVAGAAAISFLTAP